MISKRQHLYEFGTFRLDPEERLLLHDSEVVPLTPKAFEVLLALIKQPGHLLEKEELLKTVWPDSFVEENNLADNISKLRKALGEGENGQKFIETIPKRGYRFVADVVELNNEAATLPLPPPPPLASQLTSPSAAGQEALPNPALVSGRIWKSSLLFVGIAILGIGAWFIRNEFAQKNPFPAPLATAVNKAESSSIKSIAILPFKQLTPHKEDEYLGLGIADTLINRLSTQRQFQVRPLNAALADKDSDAVVAGRAQKVDAVLEGTVQHIGHQLRIIAVSA